MNTQEKAQSMIAQRTTAQLIEDFETSNTQPLTVELSIVRGWLMDALEARNAEAFDAWIESGTDSPRPFFFPYTVTRVDNSVELFETETAARFAFWRNNHTCGDHLYCDAYQAGRVTII